MLDAVSTMLAQHREATDFRAFFRSLENNLYNMSMRCWPGKRLLWTKGKQLEVTAKGGWSWETEVWQNLCFLGLTESTEGSWPTEFFSGQDTFPSPAKINHAHRSLAAKPAPDQRPRLVIPRLHHFQVIFLLDYHGRQIRTVEDYCPEVLSKRAQYRWVRTELTEHILVDPTRYQYLPNLAIFLVINWI